MIAGFHLKHCRIKKGQKQVFALAIAQYKALSASSSSAAEGHTLLSFVKAKISAKFTPAIAAQICTEERIAVMSHDLLPGQDYARVSRKKEEEGRTKFKPSRPHLVETVFNHPPPSRPQVFEPAVKHKELLPSSLCPQQVVEPVVNNPQLSRPHVLLVETIKTPRHATLVSLASS